MGVRLFNNTVVKHDYMEDEQAWITFTGFDIGEGAELWTNSYDGYVYWIEDDSLWRSEPTQLNCQPFTAQPTTGDSVGIHIDRNRQKVWATVNSNRVTEEMAITAPSHIPLYPYFDFLFHGESFEIM